MRNLFRQFPLPVKKRSQQFFFTVAIFICLTHWVSSGTALLLGFVMTQYVGDPFAGRSHKITHHLLQFSVVGLGFGMNAGSAMNAGKEGFVFTVISIFSTLLWGYFLGRIFIKRKERRPIL